MPRGFRGGGKMPQGRKAVEIKNVKKMAAHAPSAKGPAAGGVRGRRPTAEIASYGMPRGSTKEPC